MQQTADRAVVAVVVRGRRARERLARIPLLPAAGRAARELGYDKVFRVVIVQFLDQYNFCLGGVKRSCIHFVTPNGHIIPFDTYNMFYRDGKIDGIRARMKAEMAG